MYFKDLRSFVDYLEDEGELLRIKEELNSKFEVAAAIRYGSKMTDKAVLVENIRGYDCPVLGNLLGTKKRMGAALNAGDEDSANKILVKEDALIPHKTVDKGPVKDIIIRDDIDLLKTLPVLTYHEGDVSPYITQGIVFMKDRESGAETMGIHRLQVKGKDRLGMLFGSKTSTEIFNNANKRGESLEIAVAIGVDPATLLASVFLNPFGPKFDIAGALRGAPLDLIKAETVDLRIPAQAMYILEGRVIPDLYETEGPFGESSGYYITAENPVIQIEAITHRKDPLYPVFVPWDKEDGNILDLLATPHIHENVKKSFPSVIDVRLFFDAGYAVVSMKKRTDFEPRELIYFLLSTVNFIKIVMIVDDDVDLTSQKEINWAMGTRCYMEKDLILVKSVGGNKIDPTAKGKDFVLTKCGLDATKPLGEKDDFRKVAPPIEVQQKISRLLQKYLG